MKKWLVSLCCIGISFCTMAEPIKVLVVDGFSNHDWQHTTKAIQGLLADTNRFDVSVSTYSGEDWNPSFSGYDVVVQTCNDIKCKTRWPQAVETALETYVANGGGLYIFHSANNAFPHWKEYDRMIGLGWRNKDYGWAITVENGEVVRIPAGEGGNTSHGKRTDALLTRMGDHPIHAGLPRQWVAADIEIYRYARGAAENLTVLSYAKEEKTGMNFPTEWTVAYGKGRVYNSTFGHVWHNLEDDPAGIRCAGFRTIMPRAIQWLAGGEVDGTVPDDFPTADKASLRNVD